MPMIKFNQRSKAYSNNDKVVNSHARFASSRQDSWAEISDNTRLTGYYLDNALRLASGAPSLTK